MGKGSVNVSVTGMKKTMRHILNFAVRKMARLGVVWPFVYIYCKVIEEVSPRTGHTDLNKPTILALQPSRFRGDLQILADSGQFTVLKVPFEWQCKILALFWSKQFRKQFDHIEYYNPDGDEFLVAIQRDLRAFLRKFLSSLYARLKIDCVIGAAIHYKQDYDWGLVSDEIGIPYIVLHRENLATAPGHVARFYSLSKMLNGFRGSHIVVQNDTVKDAYIRSGYVNPENISALGCLRMDGFVRRVKETDKLSGHRKKVVLFSFTYATGLLGMMGHFPKNRDVGLANLFEHVHVAIAQLALQNSDVDFVIKPKWGGGWIDEVNYVFQKYGIRAQDIGNLSITADANVHELILESDVVCGFGSTTLLEAAIAAKPVIFPYFDEALKPEYADFVQFSDHLHLFDVAHSPDEFKALIAERLHHPMVDEECMAERYAVFEKYVSSMKGDALDKYVKVINQVIHEKQQDRGS